MTASIRASRGATVGFRATIGVDGSRALRIEIREEGIFFVLVVVEECTVAQSRRQGGGAGATPR